VQRCSTEFRLTFYVRFVSNEEFGQCQVSLLGRQMQRRPAVVVVRVDIAAVVDQQTGCVQTAVQYRQMQRRRTVDVRLLDGGGVVDEQLYDVRVSGGCSHVQRRAPVVATGRVDVGAVAEQNRDGGQQLVTDCHV